MFPFSRSFQMAVEFVTPLLLPRLIRVGCGLSHRTARNRFGAIENGPERARSCLGASPPACEATTAPLLVPLSD